MTADEPPSTPTLAAVAQQAGVSPITVSRVLRLPDLVAPQTRARVQAAMRDLGYVPNLVAGSLASARTHLVGVLVPTIANAIFADTIQGVSDELEPLGISVIVAQSGYDAARENRMLAALLGRRPDALVMVGSPATTEGERMLRGARIPVVETWELPSKPIDAVAGFDNHAAGATVARHLIKLGRRSLAFIGGQDPRATRRWLGFQDEAAAAGLVARRMVLDRTATAAGAVISDLSGTDAVFAANDALAIGLLTALRDAGMGLRPGRPPRVAVIGLGDLEMGRLISPRLSTIRVHGEAIGRAAAALTQSKTGQRWVDLGFELVLRESG